MILHEASTRATEVAYALGKQAVMVRKTGEDGSTAVGLSNLTNPRAAAPSSGTPVAPDAAGGDCMRWTPGGVSGNVEDRRGGFGGGGLKMGLGGTLVLLVLSVIFGQDFLSLVGGSPAGTDTGSYSSAERDAGADRNLQFVSFVLDDAQRTWRAVLPSYRDAKLVLFTDYVQSACGSAQSATGPFYCPSDEKVYLDTSFFEELDQRFGAPGDFAQAYVIGHEIGHHVQNLLGTSAKVQRFQRNNPGEANAASVRLELQADCLAGVWGHSTAQRKILEQGDVEEGLNAAAAIGDDRLTKGRVSPDSFTHGTSEQRVEWFRRGLRTGDVQAWIHSDLNPTARRAPASRAPVAHAR